MSHRRQENIQQGVEEAVRLLEETVKHWEGVSKRAHRILKLLRDAELVAKWKSDD